MDGWMGMGGWVRGDHCQGVRLMGFVRTMDGD